MNYDHIKADKDLELLMDMSVPEVSDCCSAIVYQMGSVTFCQSCSEPCDAVDTE